MACITMGCRMLFVCISNVHTIHKERHRTFAERAKYEVGRITASTFDGFAKLIDTQQQNQELQTTAFRSVEAVEVHIQSIKLYRSYKI